MSETHPAGDAAPVRFSVVMPTFDRAALVGGAIDAVLGQTHGDFELIIVDDGSTDGTAAHLDATYRDEIANHRIRLIRLAENVGQSAARNAALSTARMPWIAYADTDNRMTPDALEAYAGAIRANAGSRIFYAGFKRRSEAEPVFQPFDRERLEEGNFIDIGVFVHARSLVEARGGFDPVLRKYEDWDLILRYTKGEAPVGIERVLLDYDDGPREDRVSFICDDDASLHRIRAVHGITRPVPVA